MSEINERIKQIRINTGLSMGKFAKSIGVSAGNVSAWEAKSLPGSLALKAIHEVWKYSADWILTGLGNPRIDNTLPPSNDSVPQSDQNIAPRKLQLISVLPPEHAELHETADSGNGSKIRLILADSSGNAYDLTIPADKAVPELTDPEIVRMLHIIRKMMSSNMETRAWAKKQFHYAFGHYIAEEEARQDDSRPHA